MCADDWPQWRGPKRSNISEETDLLATWPDGGPPLAWEATGLGDGVVPVAVAGGRVYCTGYKGDDEYCSALSETDGSLVWSVRIGPAVKESQIMRWLNQRTPTVDADRVYVVTVLGDYICLESATGKEIWRRNAINDFESKAAAAEAGVSEITRFEHRDLFESDFSKASVLTLYILPEMLQRLVPRFNELQSGSRIVSHEFAIPGVIPDQVVEVTSEEDGQTRSLYLYTTPLKPGAVK